MLSKKTWKIINNLKLKSENFKQDAIVDALLKNRGIETKKDREVFLDPKLSDVTTKSVGIDQKQLAKALKRIGKAIDDKEQIIVFGDYDVDGITGSAILWETLFTLGANVKPYIPDRKEEGYGLSTKGISNLKLQIPNITLIITTDNGIVANEAVDFANEQGMDVIITDHHVASETLPKAHSIVHTTSLCGAGVAYLLANEVKSERGEVKGDDKHLELAGLGTVADLVPLTGANRTIVKEGLKKLQVTNRPGLLALFSQAGIKQDDIGVYDIGYLIGPRLNAAGRIDSAMDSLRLLCTKDHKRAYSLASQLEGTNKERQKLLKDSAEHAISKVKSERSEVKSILVIGHETYPEGVIGLVAGKLVEAFYRPAIVLSIGETHSKASARSVSGFNIIEFLRSHREHFINVGGHPMAAGFTIETVKIGALREALEKSAETLVDEVMLTRLLKIDMELPLSAVSTDLYDAIQALAPFGMGNPEPVFAAKSVTVQNIRVMGKEANHLRLMLSQKDSPTFEAVAFGMGELSASMKVGDKIDVAYVMDENTWNGNTKLQLKVRDIQLQ